MFYDCFNLKIGWMVSMYIAVVPLGFDMAYPAELQNLCALPPLSLSLSWDDVLGCAINCRWSENESDQIADRPLRRRNGSALYQPE